MEEVKQLEGIKTKVKKLLENSKFNVDASSNNDKLLILPYNLRDNATLKISLYFQNIFSEKSNISLEHWKNLSKEFPQFETKHKALFKLVRMWR